MRSETAKAIEAAARYLSIKRADILKYIPYKPGISSTTSFRVLITIATRKGLTATGVKKLYKSFSHSLPDCVSYLENLGLIEPVNKPRWVPGIHAWKNDKAYRPTPLGKKCVFELFEGVLMEEIAVDYANAS